MKERFMILGLMMAVAIPTIAVAQTSDGSTGTMPSMGAPASTDTSSSATTQSVTSESASNPEPGASEEKKKDSIYYKKVRGKLFIEFFSGPTSFNPTKIKDIEFLPRDLATGDKRPFNYKDNGASIGGAIGFQPRSFSLALRVQRSKYDAFNFNTAGLDFGFLIRIPYVHPYLRFGFHYAWLGKTDFAKAGVPTAADDGMGGTFNLAEELDSKKIRGGAVSGGFGVRVPIIKHLSIAGGVDFFATALYRAGALSMQAVGTGEQPAGGAIGVHWQGNIALTAHLF